MLIVVIFTLWSGAEGSFGGVNEAEASRGGSVLGKWLGDHRRSSTLEDDSYGNRNDVIFEGYNFPILSWLSMTCMKRRLSERNCTGLG